MRKILGVILVLVALVCPTTIATRSILFQIKCGGHMSLASKANSIDLAKREMEIVVKYLEDRNLTNGNTAILWDTPKRDLGFFYNNMKASLEELKSVSGDASSLEKSNILIKLRETLTEQGEKSENITAPNGISRFPHNVAYAVWFVSSIFLALAGVFTFMWGYRYPFP